MPTQDQLNNRLNPTPVTVATPASGLFKSSGDFGSQLYRMNPDGTVSNINLLDPNLGLYTAGTSGAGNQASQAITNLKSKYGIDYNSLQSYNIGDLQSSGAVKGFVYDPYGQHDANNAQVWKSSTNINDFINTAPATAGANVTLNGSGTVDPNSVLPNMTPAQTTAFNSASALAPGNQPSATPASTSTNLGANGQYNTSTGTALGIPLTPAQSQAPQYTLPSSINSSNTQSTGTTNYQQPANTNGTTTAAMAGVNGTYQQQLAAAEKEGPQDQSITNLINQTLGLNTQDAGKTAFTNQENAVDTNGAGSSVNARQAAVNSLQATQQQNLDAYNASQLQDQQGQGVTTAVDQRQRDAVTKQYAITSLATSSLLAAAQGDLANAQTLAKQAVSAIYDPIEAQIAANTANINLLKADPATTAEEKTQADNVAAILNAQAASAAQNKANATAVSNIGVTAASYLNNFVPTAQYPTAAQALAAITANQNSSNPDPMAAQLIATQTGLTAPTKNLDTSTVDVNGQKVLINNQTGATIKVLGTSTTSTAAPKTYTIASGDTLYAISQKKGITLSALQDANPSVDANNLRPGQVINLPTNSSVSATDLKQSINAAIAASGSAYSNASDADKAAYIRSLNGNPTDFGVTP